MGKKLGGQGEDFIIVINDGGFLLSGASNSSELTRMGVAKWAPWILRLDASGNLLWDIRLKRTGFEFPPNRLFLEPDGSFLLAGYSDGLWALSFAPEEIIERDGFLWTKPAYVYPGDPLRTFHLSGPIGSRWDIERSTDLLNWSKATDIILNEPAVSFTDSAFAGEKGFFRAKAR